MEVCFLVLDPHFQCQIGRCKLHKILATHPFHPPAQDHDAVIQHRKTEALFGFDYPAQITAPTENLKSTHRTFSEFRFLERLEQSEAVEHLERFEPNPGWWARGINFLEHLIRGQKRGAKPPEDAIYAIFCR